MKPTPEQIIELAREAGFEFDKATKYEPPQLINRGKHALPAFERFATLLLERFGAGGGEPVAYVCPTSHVMEDGSMEDGPDYLEWADEASDYEKRVGAPLYTHPSPTDLRAEYLRGLEDAAKVCDEYSGNWYAYRKGAEQCAASIRALKGKQ